MTEKQFERAKEIARKLDEYAELHNTLCNSKDRFLCAYSDGKTINSSVLDDDLREEFLAIVHKKEKELCDEFESL